MRQINHSQADTVLHELTSVLKATLDDKLLGAYLYGSLATDDFVEGQSDIDLLMVVKKEVDYNLVDSLISLHKQFNSEHKTWQKRIDVAYVSRAALWTFQTKPYKAAVSDDKDLLTVVDVPQYYLIDWYKLQEHGLALFGPEVCEILPHISADEFRRSLYDYMQTYAESVKSAEKRGEQAYVIVTMCRSLYAYKFAKHVSKKLGSSWAMDEYVQWRELIQKRLDWNRNTEVDTVVDQDHQRATAKFVSFMLGEAK